MMKSRNWGKFMGAIAAIALPLLPPINSQTIQVAAQEPVEGDYFTAQQLDDIADRIFYERHPELNGRKIQPDELHLVEEWQGIRRCEALVDYIFYQRHPELGVRKIRPDEKWFAREWQEIRDSIYSCK